MVRLLNKLWAWLSESQLMKTRSAAKSRALEHIALVFRRVGYEAASMRLLSEHSKLGRSSLYHHFPGGKEDMAMAVLEWVEQILNEELMAPLTTPHDCKEAVEAFLTLLQDYYQGGRLGCILGVLSQNDCPPAVADKVKQITEGWLASLSAFLKRYQIVEPENRAKKIIRIIQGGLVVAKAAQDTRHFDAALEETRELLLGY